jgi:hypothetical protein
MNQPGLLAHLSLQFARSEENCATEALTFLLRGSPEARGALHDYVARLFGVDLSPHLTYRSQVTDAETGRPDVVGTDPADADQLVIEAKFWAGLTDKQPGAYLERLRAGEPGVVLVVAPAARLQSLWRELLVNLAEYRSEPVASADHEPGRYEKPLQSGHILALRSWREVLNELDGRLRATGLGDWLADLEQLRGLTERMDQTGFLPLQPEDLDMRTARQLRSLFPLVRRLVDEFGSGDLLVKDRKKHLYDPRPFFGWWLRSKSNVSYYFWVGLYLDAWVTHGCSPLWAAVYPDANWTMPELDLALSQLDLPEGSGRWEDEVDDAYIVPLLLKRSAVEDDVVADLKAQLCTIVELLDRGAARDGH